MRSELGGAGGHYYRCRIHDRRDVLWSRPILEMTVVIMPANVTSPEVRSLMAEFPNMLGNLFSPGAWQTPHGIYALDNGRFGKSTTEWSKSAWFDLLRKAESFHRAPEWVLCPDVVGHWKMTKHEWSHYSGMIRSRWPVALAVQDGATVVEAAALYPNVIFVGGSTRWKMRTAPLWCKYFPRVHVARVNTVARAMACFDMGAESVDGTGWMRTTRQRKLLRHTLELMSGKQHRPLMLWRNDGSPNREAV